MRVEDLENLTGLHQLNNEQKLKPKKKNKKVPKGLDNAETHDDLPGKKKKFPKKKKRVATLDQLRRDYNMGIQDFNTEEAFANYSLKRHAALMKL